MAFTFQTQIIAQGAGADTTITTGTLSTTTGWLTFAGASFENASSLTFTFSDSQSHTNWTTNAGTYERHLSVGQSIQASYHILSSSNAAHTWSCAFSGSTSVRGLSVGCFAAADTITRVSEDTDSNGTAVSSITTPTLTLDNSSGLLVAAMKFWSGGTITMSDGTIMSFQGFHAHGYKILSASGASSVTFNHSGTSYMSVAAMLFREGAASGGGGSDALSGSAATGGLGTQAPGHSIGL